ncbi:MAG: hypothetical protein CO094_06465 [Anaerolineae bacterium CG_4_9_14_3_um_filter_57_17]|nr:DUF3054 domain-containing protein [bacterium]NCT21524.1 DUF3054 domain-containing protein [bacterium]OIO86783.1 MAG: hypothetical protein AUK01_01990 [Anaerolineae bacterium CG2_30_57_67]PJB66690.1 MAG: hypothetical protein CO094_06465 [Anaerolineae bacterium CG_4_9_14_3_um_filter_57_17]
MKRWMLVVGDVLALAALTVIGFATHGESGPGFIVRMASTFIPLVVAWFGVAPMLGLYASAQTSNPRALWRPVYAMFLAGPLAVLLRALWLDGVVIPIFGLVLTGSGALALLLWRGIWLWLEFRQKR